MSAQSCDTFFLFLSRQLRAFVRVPYLLFSLFLPDIFVFHRTTWTFLDLRGLWCFCMLLQCLDLAWAQDYKLPDSQRLTYTRVSLPQLRFLSHQDASVETRSLPEELLSKQTPNQEQKEGREEKRRSQGQTEMGQIQTPSPPLCYSSEHPLGTQ